MIKNIINALELKECCEDAAESVMIMSVINVTIVSMLLLTGQSCITINNSISSINQTHH